MTSYDALIDGVLKGEVPTVEAEVNKAIQGGANPRDIMEGGLIGGMGIVGELFGKGEMFLPEVLMSSKAMHSGISIVQPLMATLGQIGMGRVVIGTVEGDIHDIGKRIVGFLIEGNGFEVTDLGVDVRAEAFVQAIQQYRANILGMSALLTTTRINMAKTINLLEEKGLRENIRVIIGGASVNVEFAKSIGADGYAPDASSAVQLVRSLMNN
jgi:5-methyltetrahydrofolate--homocysteine methyltransferase